MNDEQMARATRCELLDAAGAVIATAPIGPGLQLTVPGFDPPLQPRDVHAARFLDADGAVLGELPTTYGRDVKKAAAGMVERLAEGLLAGLARMA